MKNNQKKDKVTPEIITLVSPDGGRIEVDAATADGPAEKTVAEILARRATIEREVVSLLIENERPFELTDVQYIVYFADKPTDMAKIASMLGGDTVEDRKEDMPKLRKIMEMTSLAWNYFPCKRLGDISSAEAILEERGK